MKLPNTPDRSWQGIRHNVLVKNSIEWVQQDEVPPIPLDLDAHTDVFPGVRVHHRSWASGDDIAVWEPGNANIYFVTRYEVVKQLLDSKDDIPQGVITVLLLAGGTVVVKFLWDILKTSPIAILEPPLAVPEVPFKSAHGPRTASTTCSSVMHGTTTTSTNA